MAEGQPNVVQRIFIVWFILLTAIALYNFSHNVSDNTAQSILETTYAENKDRYDKSIAEHDNFKADINYLKGRVGAPCANPQPTLFVPSVLQQR